jgi:hypothetical protein
MCRAAHLIYSNRNTVFAMPFDVAARQPRGAAVPVLTDVAYDPRGGHPADGHLEGRHGRLSP